MPPANDRETIRGAATMSSALPEARNYHLWIFSLFEKDLRGRVLEIGMGYGQYTNWIADRCNELTVVDIDAALIRNVKGWLPSHAQAVMDDVSAADFSEHIGQGVFSFAVCLNVLEHIEDDLAAMNNLYRVLEPGGRAFILVPAHSFLYSEMDRMAGHWRRYTLVELTRLAGECGFEIEKAEYLNPIGGIGWWLNAVFNRPKTLSDQSINRQILLFDRYGISLSRFFNRFSRKWFGQSAWIILRRPQ